MSVYSTLQRELDYRKPEYSYWSDMYTFIFIHENRHIFLEAAFHAEIDIELDSMEMSELGKKILNDLPYKAKPILEPVNPLAKENAEWAASLAHLGSKRDKKG